MAVGLLDVKYIFSPGLCGKENLLGIQAAPSL